MLFFITAIALQHLAVTFAATCDNPSVQSSYYIADDAIFHYSTAFVVEFVPKCSNNNAKALSLYAEVNGRLIPVGRGVESNRYQVSWTEEHDKAKSGTYNVNVYDEDGYAAIRKAIRNEQDISTVKPLFSVDVKHGGPSKGPMIQTHMMSLACALALWYVAFHWKSNIEA